MTLRHLEIFVKVVNCGKMNLAAEELFISQSSVSQAIAEIEKKYNVQLFERIRHKLYLTPAGNELLDYARKILALNYEMESNFLRSSALERIRIGTSVTVSTYIITPVITRLLRTYPAANPTVFAGNVYAILENLLLKGEIDIGLVGNTVSHPDVISKHVLSDKLVIVCGRGHPFWGRESVSISELADQPFIMRELDNITRQAFENFLKERRILISVIWTCYNAEAVKNAVIDGHGITCLSERSVRKECLAGELWAAAIAEAKVDLKLQYNVVYHRRKQVTEVMRHFIEAAEKLGNEKAPTS